MGMTEPDWLQQRRRNGASLAQELALPTQKQKGWEFTDLAGFDPDSFDSADGGDAAALERVNSLVAPFEGGLQIRQVDSLALDADAAGDRNGGPIVMPLSMAIERHPDLVKPHLGTIVPSEDPFV